MSTIALDGGGVAGTTPRLWPSARDPRLPFAALLTLYAVLGLTFLGFNRTPWQMLALVASGCLLDLALTRTLRGVWIVPLSAYITCCSLALLLNYAHASWLLFLPVLLAIGSKHVITFKGRHVLNPSMFGVSASLLLTNELITAAPAYQWAGGRITMSAFIVAGALMLFVFRVGRGALIVSFLIFYALQTALRAYVLRYHLPPASLFLGTLSTPAFFIFTFYMITDPATSPPRRGGQVLLAFALTVVDLLLHFKESVFTFFYAALICGSARLLFLHGRALIRERPRRYLRERLTRKVLLAWGLVGGGSVAMGAIHHRLSAPSALAQRPPFDFIALPPSHTGIETRIGPALSEVDPRVAHIAKWLLSVGDSIATADVDGDGRQDLLFTQPLKAAADRVALYRNLGGFRFQRVHLQALENRFQHPAENGIPAGATFVDWDGDGDEDLALAVGFGRSRLYRNLLRESGRLDFQDVSSELGFDEHTVSLAITFFDANRDGRLDLLVTNAMGPYLPGYDRPTPLNVFALPAPAFPGDRRMFHFMHDGWHDASNGGPTLLYHGTAEGRFAKADSAAAGLTETHWQVSVATGDLNGDGWTDVYLANDFGPDDLYMNDKGRFRRVKGRLFGEVGRDTYKGMNSTMADFDRNGLLDVYVSNNHHALQSEGSLLWMTRRDPDATFGVSFSDEATRRNALNERRWGWGAAAGDLDRDGWLDLVQANGMIDDRLDRRFEGRKDYWYVNHKLMQAGPAIHSFADSWGDLRGREIYPNEARRVYLNLGERGPGYFVDVTRTVGATGPECSRGVALSDLDDDGDLDMVITNQFGAPSIYRNDGRGTPSHFIGLALRGHGGPTHPSAIGTQVTIRYQHEGRAVEQLREVSLLGGFSGQGDRRLHFGLGAYQGPVEATISWYGGPSEKRTLASDAYHQVVQP